MEERMQAALKERYMAATESFISKVKEDPNVIAVIISGSLAYDLLWEKSDIDMTLIIRDQQLKNDNYCIIEDGITINVFIMQRSRFKRGMERNLGGSFSQSYFANGQMVYTKDESLSDYFEDIKKIGEDDIALSALFIAGELITDCDKAKKWLTVRKDPLYAQYFLLRAAETIAHMELCLQGKPTSRQAIQKAMLINPEIIGLCYQEAMSHLMSDTEIEAVLEKLDAYLVDKMEIFKKPVVEFMGDGELKTMTIITKHFQKVGHFIIDIFDYLNEKGVIEKVSQTIRITPKSKMAVEEIGFIYIEPIRKGQ